jgi:poly-beta-1,6-N-acetyl-D-glucosamine synthase
LAIHYSPALITFIVLLLIYCVFLLWCYSGWKKNKIPAQTSRGRKLKLSIIIPVRNEQNNIKEILENIFEQNFDKNYFEIIIADDHSDDNTFNIASEIIIQNPAHSIRIFSCTGVSKKNAISEAVYLAAGDIILTTDADCRMNKEWIHSMISGFDQEETAMVCGPVVINPGKTLLEKLQSVEMAGLLGIAGGSLANNCPMICNGANLAFSKEKFLSVNGYSGSKKVSGDDTQLMLSFRKKNYQVKFLKDRTAIVYTDPESETSSLWQQRTRWASKIPATLSPFTIVIASVTWVVHGSLLILLVLSFTNRIALLIFLGSVLMKVSVEIFFLKKVSAFTGQQINPLLVIFAQPFYWLYIFVAGLISPFIMFEWKGRRVK